jgi:hypothetical protein
MTNPMTPDKPVEVTEAMLNGWQAPERIWLHDLGCGDVTWCQDPDPDGEQIEAVAYVRADLAMTAARTIEPGEVERVGDLKRKVQRLLDLAGHAPNDTHAESKSDADEIITALQLPQADSFQTRVAGWMDDCFTPEIKADKLERCDRFIEEALELVQTNPDFGRDRAHALVDYVFDRPVGETGQEVGGVMVTLAALCGPFGVDMVAEAEREYTRISQPAVIEKIRTKQASKPVGSALPVAQADRPDFAPCPTCKQYSHSIGEDKLTEAFNHFQSMFSHRGDGIPTQHCFDERTRDAAQVLMATAQADRPGEADVLRFLGEAFRNIDLPPLSSDDLADIAGGLAQFATPPQPDPHVKALVEAGREVADKLHVLKCESRDQLAREAAEHALEQWATALKNMDTGNAE